MTIVSLIFLAVSFLLALAMSWALLVPFFEGVGERENANERDELLMQKETLLDALEDLEQDYRSSKLSNEDYGDSKNELLAQTGEVLAKLQTAPLGSDSSERE